jgi:predicted HTH transcriptional regulator
VKTNGRITNAEYRKLAAVISKTAARDLDDLVEKGLLERKGERRGGTLCSQTEMRLLWDF